jgi:hypothetical protein
MDSAFLSFSCMLIFPEKAELLQNNCPEDKASPQIRSIFLQKNAICGKMQYIL